MRRRLFLALVLIAVGLVLFVSRAAVSASPALLGDQAVEPSADSNPAGLAEAFQTTAVVTGALAKLSVYVDTGSTATSLIAGIYADAGGNPGGLLGQGALNAPVAGTWNDVSLPGVTVTAGTPYWIALLAPGGTLRFRDRCCGGGSAVQTSSQTTLATLPGTWTKGAAYKDGPFSVYGSSADSPVLVVSPSGLPFAASVGGAAPPAQALGISNGGAGTLSWSSSTSASWLSLAPASGSGPTTGSVTAATAGLAAGTYPGTITITAAGAQGSPQTVNVTLVVTQPDSQPPSAPANLGSLVSGSSVSLSWGASTDNVGVTRFDVYRSTISGFVPSAANRIAQPTGPSYTDPSLTAGTYYYVVAAEDAAGNVSSPSNEASATVVAPPPPAFLVGDQSIEAKTDYNAPGLAEAFRTTAIATGTVSKLTVFVDSTSTATTLVAGLYAANGAHPGTLLGQGSLNGPTAGAWNDIPVTAVQVTSGTTYWIALLGPSGAGTVRFRDHGGGTSATPTEVSSQTTLTTLPSIWATGGTATDGPISMWGGGAGPVGPPPDQVGQWSAPTAWPIVAVHMSLLPTGNVLAFDAWSDAPNSQRIWSPVTGAFIGVPYGANLFCAGHVLLPDGRTLVVGGNVQADVGIKDATIFNASTNQWSKGADMSVTRWYPTATVLGSGKVFVFSGDSIVDFGLPYSPHYFKEASQNSLPSVYDPATDTWSDLTGSKLTSPLYPFLFQLSNGRVLDAGPDPTTRAIDPVTGIWSTVTTAPFDGMSAVMYAPDKIMTAGTYANPDYYGANAYAASARTAVIDMSQSSPGWRETAPMNHPRAYGNLTLLPDGSVLASGGLTVSDGTDLSKAVLPAEIWNPTTQTWTEVASLSTGRGYHSTAILLPDGRVLMAGGGQLPGRATNIYSGEIYSPPYLFKGSRPTISSAPSLVGYGSSFTVSTPDSSSIQKVALIRTPSVTHAFDQNQRYIPLTFTPGAAQLTVQAPSNANVAPPGYYMLYIVNGNGVPSVASFVRFPAPYEDMQPPTTPGGLTAASSGTTVNLSWSASTDNTAVTLYDVYRSTSFGFTPALANRIAQTPATTYADAGLGSGTYYYGVKAEDAAGNLSGGSTQASATVTATDATAPTVSLTAPMAGATVSGSVTVSGNATDNVGVVGVQFSLDGASLGVEDTATPYSVSWDTTAVTNGSHVLAAVARDAAGNRTTSAPVTVNVQNGAPPPLTFLLGDQTVEPKVDFNNAGAAEAFKTVATATGTLRKLTVYVDATSTATLLVAGVYADSGGHPGTLLVQGTLASPAAGAWNDVVVPAAAITTGTTYWIAILAPNGAGTLRFRDRCCGGGLAVEGSSQATLASLPVSWTTGGQWKDGPLAGYGAGTFP